MNMILVKLKRIVDESEATAAPVIPHKGINITLEITTAINRIDTNRL
jgi:hypothetical protein